VDQPGSEGRRSHSLVRRSRHFRTITQQVETNLDIERLPYGKFDTYALVLGCSMLAYNLLRWIGQNGLLDPRSPRRHKAKRRRLKTVM